MTRVRQGIGLAAAAVITGLLVLLLFDILKPPGGPDLGLVLFLIWSLTLVLAVVAAVMISASWCFARRSAYLRVARRLRNAGLIVGAIAFVPGGLIFLEGCVYDPLKFSYLIRRVEGASTPAAERAAFALASRWGRVWEVNRLTKREWWPEHKRHLQGAWLLELEWLESSLWTGDAYRAYRVVLDERNLEALYGERGKKKPARRRIAVAESRRAPWPRSAPEKTRPSRGRYYDRAGSRAATEGERGPGSLPPAQSA